MRVGFVREAGGFGDIICVGGAARALKEERDCETVLFIPSDFVEAGSHLEGVDKIVELGRVKSLVKRRRQRLSPMKDVPYLQVTRDYGCDELYDMFCPAFMYECSVNDSPLLYTRSQLFGMAAGVSSIQQSFPVWKCRDEELVEAEAILAEKGIEKPFIACGLRGTCSARSVPLDVVEDLFCTMTENRHRMVLLDSLLPRFKLPEGSHYISVPFPLYVAIVQLSAIVLTVDSCLLHISKALDKRALGLFGPTDATPFRKWYRSVSVVECTGTRCGKGCNYNVTKGWNKEACRAKGCVRMLSIEAEAIVRRLSKEAAKCYKHQAALPA